MLHAFIDESGVRGTSPTSSDHFVMSAIVFRDADQGRATRLLVELRQDLGRSPGQSLAWKHLKAHDQRLHASAKIGQQSWLRTSSVIVCKRELEGDFDSDSRYLHTLQLLLERLSWLARDDEEVLHYTLAHIVRFKVAKLRAFEDRLRGQSTQIAWSSLDPRGGKMIHPNGAEELQLADLVASGTAAAFERDHFGHTERRYLRKLSPCIYRRQSGHVSSYGLKMHPWRESTRAAHPWVAAL